MLWTTQKTRHPQHIVTHKIYDEWVLSTTYPHNICTVSTTYVHPQAIHSTTYDCTPQHTSTTYKTLSTTCSVMDTRATYLLLFLLSGGGHFGAMFLGCGAHVTCCGEQGNCTWTCRHLFGSVILSILLFVQGKELGPFYAKQRVEIEIAIDRWVRP